MKNFQEQVKGLDIKVSPNNHQVLQEYRKFDDYARVIDLRKNQSVLTIGSNWRMSNERIGDLATSLTNAKHTKDALKLINENKSFDKVIATKDTIVDGQFVENAFKLTAKNGLTCFFSDDVLARSSFTDIVDEMYPYSEMWAVNSNIGPLVMVKFDGKKIANE